ncbi:TonB-dependent receptor [Mucilaginibacter sp. cycad4]|uniref:TonB-dependent receptor n=1 Tax=Mucilaginibacter sp. cycad4 TaxID=3342096 RepID=UPI002AAAF30D|nr:TonB-dependent receptor [Mucilaginibacter gossypii]WPV02128.1 TonB-dependent receptor [Mucilaginibacter gossypii]
MKKKHLLFAIMQISFIQIALCLTLVGEAVASNTKGQVLERKISVAIQDQELSKALISLEKVADITFVYSPALISSERKVTLNYNNAPLVNILNELFASQNIKYEISGNTIVLNRIINGSTDKTIITEIAQSIAVTGRITDERGEPIVGVSILVKGTINGTTTDINGKFNINVANAAAVLQFKYIGYETKEVTVGNQTVINISLIPSAKSLNEIVVIGYGTQKKRDVTGSVVSVSGNTLREVPVANISQALQGRASGVEVQAVGTRPGAGAQIRIRGDRSITAGNDPLFVLDGIPYSGTLNDINPDDIASIDILKDASATAIYGSRGANGVILVTTKRGAVGDTRVNLSSYYGITGVTSKYKVYNADQYRALRDLSIYTQGYTSDELQGISTGRNTDWQDLLYKNGFTTDHNLTISGGSEKSQYSVGGGFFKQTTVLPGQDFTRGTMKITLDCNATNRLKVGFNSLLNYNITHGSQFPANVFPLLTLSPLSSPYNADGSINIKPAGNTDDLNNTYNPLLLRSNPNASVDLVRRFHAFNSLYGEVKITDGLKYRLNVGLDFQQEEGDQFQGTDSYFRPGTYNTASVNNTSTTKYSLDNLLTYEKTFAKKHRVSVTALFGYEQEQSHSTYVRKDSITADFVQFYNLGQSSVTPAPILSGSESTSTLVAMMLRANYIYDDKYMITLTGRTDGSSRLGEGNKYKSYPAVSAGWVISREKFMQQFSVISNLKLRAGFGVTANQGISAYQTLGGLSSVNSSIPGTPQVRYNYGTTVVNGYYISRIVDPNLDWEYTKTANIGLDFGVLGDRVTGSVEYYNANTTKLLYGVSLPPTSGITDPYLTNVGNVRNTGMEFSISSQNITAKKGGFTWSTDLNFFFNRNKLIALNGSVTQVINNQLFVGQPLSAIYDYKKLGIWQLNEAAQAAKYGFVPGQIKLEDHNGDGKLDVNDKYVIGNAQAKIQGGITNRFNYKGFDFTFVLYGRYGGTLISQVYQPLAGYTTINDGRRNQVAVDYWTPTNPTNFYPSPNVAGGAISSPLTSDAGSTLGYFDASFIKVRTITLGYNVLSKWAKKIGTQNIRVYLSSENPFILFSPYVRAGGIDPEATGTGNQGVQDPGNISTRALTIGVTTPSTKSFIAGLNITL